jgi:type I restriction enzyme S subunit
VDNSYYAGLPESWRVCRLSDIGEIIGGGTPRTLEPSFWDGDIPWITPADLSGYTKKFIETGSRKITVRGLVESSAKLMPAKSVLFSSRAPIGYCVISKNEVCTNQGFKSIVPYVGDIEEYIYYFLIAQVEEIRSRASGTTFKEISGAELGNTIFALPPLTEQKRIVAAIEAAFEQLDNKAATLE